VSIAAVRVESPKFQGMRDNVAPKWGYVKKTPIYWWVGTYGQFLFLFSASVSGGSAVVQQASRATVQRFSSSAAHLVTTSL